MEILSDIRYKFIHKNKTIQKFKRKQQVTL